MFTIMLKYSSREMTVVTVICLCWGLLVKSFSRLVYHLTNFYRDMRVLNSQSSLQGWEFALLLYALLLKIALFIEQPWAICSHCSFKNGRSWVNRSRGFKKERNKDSLFGKERITISTLLLTKNKWFNRKTKSEFPTLLLYYLFLMVLHGTK